MEFLFPYEHPAAEIRARLDTHGLAQALFNAPPGDWQAGERGIASLPGRQDEFRRGLDQALEYAARLGNRSLHVMAGLIAPGQDRAAHRPRTWRTWITPRVSQQAPASPSSSNPSIHAICPASS